MIDRYVINFVQTFGAAMLLGVEAKMQRIDKNDPKSETEQARDKDGVPKWTVTIAVQTKAFETTKYVTIPITVTSPTRPCGAIPPGSAVLVEGLELGIMAQSKGGFSVFYSAEAIVPKPAARTTTPAPANQ